MEETYCVIRDPKSTVESTSKGMLVVNFAVQREETLFTGTLQQCEDYIENPDYPYRDDFWPSRRWNPDYSDYVDLSGHSTDNEPIPEL